jgi:hypothetical protein
MKHRVLTSAQTAIQGTGKVGSSAQKWSDDEKELYAKFLKAQEVMHTAFCNNFDTPEVLQQVFGVVHAANAYIKLHKGKEHAPKALLLNKLASYVAHILGVMGIDFPEHGYGGSSAESSSSSTGSKEVLDVLAAFRKDVRTAAKEKKPHNDFLLMTDRLRDDVMPELGVRLEDDGMNSWTAVAPEVLKKEIADKRLNALKGISHSLSLSLSLLLCCSFPFLAWVVLWAHGSVGVLVSCGLRVSSQPWWTRRPSGECCWCETSRTTKTPADRRRTCSRAAPTRSLTSRVSLPTTPRARS